MECTGLCAAKIALQRSKEEKVRSSQDEEQIGGEASRMSGAPLTSISRRLAELLSPSHEIDAWREAQLTHLLDRKPTATRKAFKMTAALHATPLLTQLSAAVCPGRGQEMAQALGSLSLMWESGPGLVVVRVGGRYVNH